MTAPVILHLEKVTKYFPRSNSPAVDKVTLSLQEGDLLTFLGPSGCGKTTLLRIVAGFEEPQTGIVTLAGQTVAGKGQWVSPEKRDVGMVFQDYALFPHLNVGKNIAFGLSHSGNSLSKDSRKRVGEVLSLVGLEGLEKRYPHELSGGQQQRVALARALAPHPTLVLLDEPLSNLDLQVRLRLRQELREIIKAAGTSAIFVTHDQEEALSISDRLVVMQNGRLEQQGTPEEVYQEPATRFVAEFVTQANFMLAERQGDFWHTEIGDFLCGGDQYFEQGELMIRQEDLQLIPKETGSLLICDRQFLGREHRYDLQTPSGKRISARTTVGKVLPVGSKVDVSVVEAGLRVFSFG
ncbi:MAG: ABC transporter ATP-binding protein [Spirulinaceae cyanobacterium]